MIWLGGDKLFSVTEWTGPLEPDGSQSVYGFVLLPDGDGAIVNEVDTGSRAERAGLRVGDRVAGKQAAAFFLPGIAHEQKELGRLRLHVIRGAEQLEISMSLSDPL